MSCWISCCWPWMTCVASCRTAPPLPPCSDCPDCPLWPLCWPLCCPPCCRPHWPDCPDCWECCDCCGFDCPNWLPNPDWPGCCWSVCVCCAVIVVFLLMPILLAGLLSKLSRLLLLAELLLLLRLSELVRRRGLFGRLRLRLCLEIGLFLLLFRGLLGGFDVPRRKVERVIGGFEQRFLIRVLSYLMRHLHAVERLRIFLVLGRFRGIDRRIRRLDPIAQSRHLQKIVQVRLVVQDLRSFAPEPRVVHTREFRFCHTSPNLRSAPPIPAGLQRARKVRPLW